MIWRWSLIVRWRKLRRWILTVTMFLMPLYVFLTKKGILSNMMRSQSATFISPGCICTDNSTGLNYDFCYNFPSNSSIHGMRFNCHFLPYLQKLKLVDSETNVDLTTDQFPSPVFVTAASDSHFNQALKLVVSIQTRVTIENTLKIKIVFYDLGLSNQNVEKVKSLCGVNYKKFDFSAYPARVANLYTYRWKPILIAKALSEFSSIWYMDSSVHFTNGNLSHVYELFKCKNSEFEFPHISVPFWNITEQALKDEKFIESGFHIDRWLLSLKRCDKFAYLLQGFSGHGIFSATHPDVYKYFPTSDELRKPSAKMYEAGFLLAVRTKEVIEDVLKWYVLCALEDNCMAPKGAALGCAFSGDRFGTYAHCHRFDQSIVNLLLANRNRYHSYYWTSGIVDFFKIVRGSGISESERNLLKICV